MGGWPVGYLHSAEELTSGSPKTNPSSSSFEPGTSGLQVRRLTTRPRSPPCDPLNRFLQIIFWIYFLLSSYCFIIVAVCYRFGARGILSVVCASVLSRLSSHSCVSLRELPSEHGNQCNFSLQSNANFNALSHSRGLKFSENVQGNVLKKHNQNSRANPNYQILDV